MFKQQSQKESLIAWANRSFADIQATTSPTTAPTTAHNPKLLRLKRDTTRKDKFEIGGPDDTAELLITIKYNQVFNVILKIGGRAKAELNNTEDKEAIADCFNQWIDKILPETESRLWLYNNPGLKNRVREIIFDEHTDSIQSTPSAHAAAYLPKAASKETDATLPPKAASTVFSPPAHEDMSTALIDRINVIDPKKNAYEIISDLEVLCFSLADNWPTMPPTEQVNIAQALNKLYEEVKLRTRNNSGFEELFSPGGHLEPYLLRKKAVSAYPVQPEPSAPPMHHDWNITPDSATASTFFPKVPRPASPANAAQDNTVFLTLKGKIEEKASVLKGFLKSELQGSFITHRARKSNKLNFLTALLDPTSWLNVKNSNELNDQVTRAFNKADDLSAGTFNIREILEDGRTKMIMDMISCVCNNPDITEEMFDQAFPTSPAKRWF